MGHRHDGSDPDSPRDEDCRCGVRRQREVVEGTADWQFVPNLHLLMHVLRSPSTPGILEHGNAIAVLDPRLVEKRILPGQPIAQVKGQVRAGLYCG
ncbi:hypothetical protein D9M68_837850 [compost metagenome]